MSVPSMAILKEKIALITGASSGVGRALALELAALGALVLLVARTPQKLEAVAHEIKSRGGEARVFPVDLTSDAELRAFSNEIKQQWTRLDFLIHSAAIFRAAPLSSASADDFDAVMRCNVRAPFLLTQALLPEVIAARGTIAFINSTAGEKAHANVGHYAASKHALKALADTLRLEVATQQVRVLSVMLGRTATPMQEEVCRLEGSVYDPSRFLQPSDVARLIVGPLARTSGDEGPNLYLRHPPV